jgi:predicted ATP-binding protein involved in virulence
LINPDARKWRLEEVAISGLFGRYNHRFTLDQDHRVTILHGPNGVGKTAMLRLLYAIFAGRTFQLFATKFSELYLSFDSGETVRIRRESSVEEILRQSTLLCIRLTRLVSKHQPKLSSMRRC